MRFAWAKTGVLAWAVVTLLSGCSRQNGNGEMNSKVVGQSSHAAAPEPARFAAPKSVALKRIDAAAHGPANEVQTTSNDEREPSHPPSVLKRKAPSRDQAENAPQPLPRRQENRGDLDAVAQRAQQLIDQAYGLADRGAIFSARSDLLTAMHGLCEATDTVNGDRICSQALGDALTAMDEAADFVVNGDVRSNLKSIVSGHQTPVLKDVELDNVTNTRAMHLYYTFAQEKFIEASNGSRTASAALCGLGKVARYLPASDSAARRNTLVKAIVFQNSAVGVWNKNFHAKNELGVLYALLNSPENAKQYLLEVAQATNWPNAWTNLAQVHRQLKEEELAARAMTEAGIARKSTKELGPVKAGALDFQWVSPEQFAAENKDEGPAVQATRPSAATRR